MKYLKKYKFIIERKDLEKREEISDLLNDIVIIIKNHFINIANNILTSRNKINDYVSSTMKNLDLEKLEREDIIIKKETLEIPIENHKFKIVLENNGKYFIYGKTYGRTNNNTYLIVSLGEYFFTLIENIFILPNDFLLSEIDKIKNYEIPSNMQDSLFHELVHATDDMKFDVFNDLMKCTKLLTLKKAGKGLDDPEYTEEYFKNYPNFTTEYNAYFMMSVNKLLNKLKNNEIKWTQINDFYKFKEFFTMLTLNYFDFYDKTTKFKKHYDKRMYDLYTKLKEKYDEKN